MDADARRSWRVSPYRSLARKRGRDPADRQRHLMRFLPDFKFVEIFHYPRMLVLLKA